MAKRPFENLVKDGGAWYTLSSDSTPQLNRWYSVEMRWVKDSVDGLVELYVDGEVAISATGVNTAALGDVETIRFGLAEAVSCGPTTVNVDCFAVSDTYIGPEDTQIVTVFEDGFEI